MPSSSPIGDLRLTTYEIGEDGGRWLVVGNLDLHRKTITVAEARLAVIALLNEQLMPGNDWLFACQVVDVLDAPAQVHESPVYSDPDTELVYALSPIGGTPVWGDRIGTCAVAIGFTLPDHRTVRRALQEERNDHTNGSNHA